MGNSYYQHVSVNKKIKIKSSAYLDLPLETKHQTDYVEMQSKTGELGPDFTPIEYKIPLSFESLYKGNQGFSGYEILSKLVTDAILPRALRYGLLYNYFGYPVANVSPTDQVTEAYKSDQAGKFSHSKQASDQYPEKVFPQGNMAYIVPFYFAGQYEPIFYQLSYLEYAFENHNEGYEENEGISSIGSYYDLAKKANKKDDFYYAHQTFEYLRGSTNYGGNPYNCRVDPISVHYCLSHANILNDLSFFIDVDKTQDAYNNKYEFSKGSEDFQITKEFVEYNKDQVGLCVLWKGYNKTTKQDLHKLLDLEQASGKLANANLYSLAQVLADEGAAGGITSIAAIPLAKSFYQLSSNQLWRSVTNSVHKTWAKAFLPGNITPSAGSLGETQEGTTTEVYLEYIQSNNNENPTYAPNAGPNPGQEMREIVGKYANTEWYWQYDLVPSEYNILDGSPTDSSLYDPTVGDIPLWKKFKYSNIASAFALVPGPKVKNQKDFMFYLTNPNETLNAIVPQIIDYVQKVVPKSLDSSANDSMDGIKKFRISSKIQEDIPPEDLDSELYANYKLGTNANKENDQTYLGTGWIYSQGSNPDQNKIDLATWPSFGEYSLQTPPDINKLDVLGSAFMPDNVMLVPEDPISIIHMLKQLANNKVAGNNMYLDAAQTILELQMKPTINSPASKEELAARAIDVNKALSELYLAKKFATKPFGFYNQGFPNPSEPFESDSEVYINYTEGSGIYDTVGFNSETYETISEMSQLLFPVWHYTKDEISQLNWKQLIETPDDEEKYADQIADFAPFKNRVNYGLPDWVSKLSIYPSMERTTTSAGLSFVNRQINRGPGGNEPFFFAYETGEDANLSDDDILVSSLNKHIKTFQTSDFTGFVGAALPWVKYNYNYIPSSNSYQERVTIRYVVELEIDESKLIADLAGYGAVSLAGLPENYLAQGFDVTDLLIKSNGNIENDILLEEYEKIIAASDSLGIDPSQFPSLFPTEEQQDTVQLEEKENQLIEEFGEDYTNAVIIAPNDQNTVALKRTPGQNAENIGYVDNYTFVKVLKEWVNGKGEFDRVKITDPDSAYNGSIGFISPDLLTPSPKSLQNEIFFDNKFNNLELAQTEVQYMSDAALALNAPKWFELSDPFYYKGEGEYWVNVKLPAASFDDVGCIVDEQDLENKKKFAKDLAVREVFDYLSKSYTDSDVEKLLETYLAVRIDEGVDNYYLNLRPGEPVQFLVKIGAIYVKAFASKAMVLEDLKKQSTYLLDLDTRYYQQHITQTLYSLNKIYLDIFTSQFSVKGFDALREAKRISVIPVEINRLIAINGFDLGNKNLRNRITIGFDENYKVTFVSYREQNSEETLLEVGLSSFINREPFVYQNTMSLFYHHRLLKNPTISWKDVVETYLVNPKAKIVVKDPNDITIPSSTCAPPSFVFPDWQDILQGIAQQLDTALDLDPRFDVGSFQFSLLQLFPPCPKPPSGKGPAWFQGILDVGNESALIEGNFGDNGEELLAQFNEAIESTKEWASDSFFSSESLKDVRTKIWNIDDLNEYVLNYIDPASLYSRICKCFLDIIEFDEIKVPNFEINAEGGEAGMRIRPAQAMVNKIAEDEEGPQPSALEFQAKGPKTETNFFDPDKKVSISTDDLICSFCFNIPSVFLRLPTMNILDEFIKALKALLEFAIAQLLLSLIATALDILSTCPEIQCPTGGENVKDYGRSSLNNVFDDAGVDPLDLYEGCGIFADDNSIDRATILAFMDSVSSKLSTIEILGLLDGTPDITTLNVIQGVLNEQQYSALKVQMDTKAKIEDFFACAGVRVPSNILGDLEDNLLDAYNNVDFCKNLYDEASGKLADKCGDTINAQEILDKISNLDLDNYKNIANIFRNTDDLSTELPPMFSDGKGVQSIMSQLTGRVPSIDYAVDKVVETSLAAVSGVLTKESIEFNSVTKTIDTVNGNEYKTIMVAPNESVEDVLQENIGLMGARLLFMSGMDKQNNLVRNIDVKLAKMGDYVYVNPTKQIIQILSDGTSVEKQALQVSETMSEEEKGAEEFIDQSFDALDALKYTSEGINIVKIDFAPPKKENGVPKYTNNYEFSFVNTSSAISHVSFSQYIASKNNALLSGYTSYPLRNDTSKIVGDKESIPPNVMTLLEAFPLDGSSQISEHSQFFGSLLSSGIMNGALPYMFAENLDPTNQIGFGIGTAKDYLPEDIVKMLSKDVYWSLVRYIIHQHSNAISKNGLLGKYDDNPFNKLDGSIENILGLGGVLPIVTAMAVLQPAFTFIAFSKLTRKLYRRELQNLDLAPTMVNSNGTLFPSGLINFEAVANTIKNNYDVSKYNDPNSNELSSTNLAFAEGWISGLIQMFASEFFCKSIHSTSVFPEELYRDEELLVEYIFSEFKFWLDLPQNAGFAFKYIDLVASVIRSKSEWTPDDESNNSGLQLKGELYDINLGKVVRIDSWEDATKMLIRNYYMDSLGFIKSRVNSLQLVGNPSPQDINPIQELTYSKILEICDPPYGLLVSDVGQVSNFVNAGGNPPDDSELLKQGINITGYQSLTDQSLCHSSRISEFYNGKLFFQSFFELNELKKGSGKYNSTMAILTNNCGYSEQEAEDLLLGFKNRPIAFRGKVSRNNIELIVRELSAGDGFLSYYTSADQQIWKEIYSSEESDVDMSNGGFFTQNDEDKLNNLKYYLSLEDFFESVRFGVRMCYGFVATDAKIGDSDEPLIPNEFSSDQTQGYQLSKIRELADKIDDILDPFGNTVEDEIESEPNNELVPMLASSALNKSLRICENIATPYNHTENEKKSYIFPIISNTKTIVGDKTAHSPALGDGAMSDFFQAPLISLGNETHYDYYKNKLFLDNLMVNPVIVNNLNTMVSEILSSTPYASLFRYSIPVSKIMTMLSIYNAQEVSHSIPVSINFLGTKAVLKDLLETIYDTRGVDSYKNESSTIQQSGGSAGIAISSQKKK